IEGARQLLAVGIFSGISGGAALAVSARCAAEIDAGVVVTVLPDGGWKYLSSGAWTDPIDTAVERAGRINYW
ncbi:MAG: cysteine synthase B, partial [Acidimicrobiales bacterium]